MSAADAPSPPEEAAENAGGGLSAPFIRRPIATIMLMVGILLVGLAAYGQLPVASLPTVNVPTVLVTAQLSGADAQTNASAVTTPLEAQFGQIPGLTQLTSSSANSFSTIALQFSLSRTIDSVAQDVLAAINAATAFLPSGLIQPPVYRKTNPADTPVLILGLTSDTLPLTTVSDYGQNILLPRLSQVSGVGLVTIGGAQQPAMRIEVNPAQLAAHGLTLEDVRTAVTLGTVDGAKGVLQGPQQSFALQTNDQLFSLAEYENLVIAYRNGAPVLVRDVARTGIGPTNSLLAGWYNRQRAVILNVLLSPGANAITTVDAIKAELPRLVASLPPGVKVSTVSDRTQTIRASVSDVEFTLILTVGLVVMTIFLFLRKLWATVIPGIAVPLSIVGTFAVMYALGYSLDNLSLMALSIAVGFVVDDAIVMIENVSRYLEEGMRPLEAALKGAGEIGFTILSIAISLIAVFIPLFMMGGVVGKMLQEFAVTVAVAIVVSAFVSLTLTPTLCALFLKPEPKGGAKHGRLYQAAERAFDWLLARYDSGLRFALRHQFATLMVMMATITVTGVLYVVIPKGFFPEQDTGMIAGITEAGQDISTNSLSERQQAVTDILLRDPAIATVASYIGPGPSSASPNQGRMWIALKPYNQRPVVQQVIARLNEQLQGVQGIRLYMQAAQDLTIGARVAKAQYQYSMIDVDPQELSYWAARMVDELKKIPGLSDIGTDEASNAPQLRIEIDRMAAARFGITPQDIDNTLYNAFGERPTTKVFTPYGQYFVIIEVDPTFRSGPGALDQIYFRSSTGAAVPLRQVASITTRSAPLVVNHQEQFPSVTISFNLQPGVSIGTAVTAVDHVRSQLHLPETIQASFQGTARAYQTALSGQVPLIGAALIAIYLILGMLYESWIHPITIISTLPSAGLGALLALMAVGMPLDVIGIIGIILLLGIVKKNGIMMVDFALAAQRGGKSPLDAVHEACRLRFRPILMTTICAMLGGVPLMVGTGIGSQIRQPLGYAIVGGLAVSQILTLFTTPVVYLYMDRLGGLISRRHQAAGAPVAGPAE
ncbi:MAG TPA: efflux RND transporter permease subunit [Crenalkalicoccus sp.]|nr:efflux RND transporter permease subunit [Crenalkalicoccus sp.]